jgi:hypothetical protein
MATAGARHRPRKISYFNYGQSRNAVRYLRAAVLCQVDATFRIVRGVGNQTVATLNMPLGSSTSADDYPLADLAPSLSAWCDTPEALDRLLRSPEVRRSCAVLMNDEAFRFMELWQGRLSAVYVEPGTCPGDRAQAMLDHVTVVAEAAERVWPVVERNWALARFWNGGGRIAVVFLVGLLLLGLALSLI